MINMINLPPCPAPFLPRAGRPGRSVSLGVRSLMRRHTPLKEIASDGRPTSVYTA